MKFHLSLAYQFLLTYISKLSLNVEYHFEIFWRAEDGSGSRAIRFNLFENIWYKISILTQTYRDIPI